jgi:hypothetical protein
LSEEDLVVVVVVLVEVRNSILCSFSFLFEVGSVGFVMVWMIGDLSLVIEPVGGGTTSLVESLR